MGRLKYSWKRSCASKEVVAQVQGLQVCQDTSTGEVRRYPSNPFFCMWINCCRVISHQRSRIEDLGTHPALLCKHGGVYKAGLQLAQSETSLHGSAWSKQLREAGLRFFEDHRELLEKVGEAAHNKRL